MTQSTNVHFIGLGGHSSGSGFVYTYLHAHPGTCILPSPTNFFAEPKLFQKGFQWYEAHWQHCKGTKLRGECAAVYLQQTEVAERIAKHYPQTKLIAVVCDPIERLYREYTRAKKSGAVAASVSLTEYIEQYPECLTRGLFGQQLTAYFALYSPLQLYVAVHEDRYEAPIRYMQSIYRFLEIDGEFVPKPLRQFMEDDPNEKVVRAWYWRLLLLPFAPLRWMRLDRFIAWLYHQAMKRYRKWRPTARLHKVSAHTSKPKPAPIDSKLRSVLEEYYENDVRVLSQLVHRDLLAEWDITAS